MPKLAKVSLLHYLTILLAYSTKVYSEGHTGTCCGAVLKENLTSLSCIFAASPICMYAHEAYPACKMHSPANPIVLKCNRMSCLEVCDACSDSIQVYKHSA